MKSIAQDFQVLRSSLLFCVVAVCAGIFLIWLSINYEQQVSAMESAAQNQQALAQKNLSSAQQDALNMQSYLVEYAKLSHIIGDEQRLDWVEAAEKLRSQTLVVDFHYTVAPQQPYLAQFSVDRGNFNLYHSPMQLVFSLQHEMQLVHFFKALAAQPTGWFQLEDCTLQRVTNTPDSLLSAQCKGSWITLKAKPYTP